MVLNFNDQIRQAFYKQLKHPWPVPSEPKLLGAIIGQSNI